MVAAAPINYALTSDLTGSAAAAVTYLWNMLESRFSLSGVRINERPHITYVQGSWPATAQADLLMRQVARAARGLPAFSLELDGISSFDVAGPVLFLRVVKHEALVAVHDALFRAAGEAGVAVQAAHHPGGWMPHCTLAMGDLTPAQLPRVRDFLRTQSVHWRCRIGSIELRRVLSGVHEQAESWPLTGLVAGTGAGTALAGR